jgi:hypothetical protein
MAIIDTTTRRGFLNDTTYDDVTHRNRSAIKAET